MLACVNAHGMDDRNIIVWQKETEILSHALCGEFMGYIIDAGTFLPITAKKGKLNYTVSEEEYSRVDMRKLIGIFPIGVLNSFSSLTSDVPVFLAKKLIQMIRVVISRDIYEFDIIENLILWHILKNTDENEAAEWSKELIKIEVNAYTGELGIDVESDEAALAEEMYRSMFANLHRIFTSEEDGEICIFFKDGRFKMFIDKEAKEAVDDLCVKCNGYGEILDAFEGTDMQPLFCQLNVHSQDGNKNIVKFIKTEEEEMYQSRLRCSQNKIIDFPLAAAFNM